MEKVIFDTNAYRYLVLDKELGEIDSYIAKIKSKEHRRNIETLLSPIVARELLAHVADKDDPSHLKCLKATKALYLHNGDDQSYRILASPEMIIARSFFGESMPAKEHTNQALVQMAYHLGKNPSPYNFRKFQRNLNQTRDQVISSENEFAENIRQLVTEIDPAATGWKIFANDPIQRQKLLVKIRSEETSIDYAAMYIVSVAKYLKESGKNISLTSNRLFDMALEFVKVFPQVISLYKFVLESMVNSEFNLLENSRSNFLWDIQLMFNLGEHTVSGDKLYFVTDDQAMIRTAIKNGAGYSVLTFQEYLDYIN